MNTILLVPKPLARDSSHFYLSHLPEGIEPIVVPKLTTVKLIREWIQENISIDTAVVLCSISSITKALTGKNSIQAQGYVLDTEYGYKLISMPSYEQRFHAPERITEAIDRAKDAYKAWLQGAYKEPGAGVIHSATYVLDNDLDGLNRFLQGLQSYPSLSCDIETYSLKHYSAGIGSIAFAWDEHNGGAIYVNNNPAYIQALAEFFLNYTGNLKWHGISFDVYVLIYVLYMDSLLDQKGLLHGLEVMLRNWDCTQLITYLATNSCSGNHLSLKEQAQEFAGDYALTEIKDITQIPVEDLLRYNLIDACSTWYVYNKHWGTVVADNQEAIYRDLFKPSTVDVIQMQLTGAPINLNRVQEVSTELTTLETTLIDSIRTNKITIAFTDWLNQEWVTYKNSTLKNKKVTLADAKKEFNPNSGKQLGKLITWLNLPVLDTTDTGAIATGKNVIRDYLNHTDDADIKALFTAIADLSDIQKITSSFIPALLNSQYDEQTQWWYLFGNFRLGGTVSGRMSSNSPNCQNIPSGSKYGKLIKSCFQAPDGFLLVGLDFAALEAKINALLTRDPEKMKIYLEGYDSHCLNTFTYWPELMPDIKQAEESDECFECTSKDGKEIIYFKGTDIVTYKGTSYRGTELFALLTSEGL
ncbi:MAG: hypothetical protein LC099_12505 [Anaerolineales bacterium]|nr:hypothetical protein [Anaerolineales bacterium]